MAPPKLRVYLGSDNEPVDAADARPAQPRTVTVALAEIFPLLTEAARNRRAWLADFADDQITISHDLYEVIQAYQHYRSLPARKPA